MYRRQETEAQEGSEREASQPTNSEFRRVPNESEVNNRGKIESIYRGIDNTDDWVTADDEQWAQDSIQLPANMGAEMLNQGGYFSTSESEYEPIEVDEDIPLCQECSPIQTSEDIEDETRSGPKSIEVQTSPYIGNASTREQVSQWSTPENNSEPKAPQRGCNLCWCNACNRPSGWCTVCPRTEHDAICGPFTLNANCILQVGQFGKRSN